METPYRALTFTKDELFTRDDANQLSANYQWINDNTPRASFFSDVGVRNDVKTVIICGRTAISKPANTSVTRATVNFGTAFKSGTSVHVSTGIVSAAGKDIFLVLNGIGSKLYPDSSGFQIITSIPNDADGKNPARSFHVNWQAFGYNTGEIS